MSPVTALPRWIQSTAAAVGILAVVILFHSPRWWLLSHPTPGSFEWDRAFIYLQQCANPWRDDLTEAVRWRFVPQVFVWLTHSGATVPLLLPWLGALALIGYCQHLIKLHSADWLRSFCATLVLATSGPILVSTGWLGLNDAWFALALCYVAFGRSRALWAATCILGTFIDERFIFGLPLCIWLRTMASPQGGSARINGRAIQLLFLALAPFLISRVVGVILRGDLARDSAFLTTSLTQSSAYLWYAPLGAWMALRFAIFPLAETAGREFRHRRFTLVAPLVLTFVPISVGFLLASDTMRTAGIALPLCVFGVCRQVAIKPRAYWLGLAAASLLVPAAHVSYTKIVPINSLPIELLRLLN